MLKLVGILALVTVAYAAEARYPEEPKPPKYANEEGCYLSKFDKVLPYEQPYYPGDDCAQYICQKSTNETLYETCGAVQIHDGCRLSTVDLSKNYPDCCGQEVCDATTTTQAPTTQAPTTQAPTTQAPTTQAPTNQPAANQGSVAYASAKSGGGQPPATETYTSGPNAAASATAS